MIRRASAIASAALAAVALAACGGEDREGSVEESGTGTSTTGTTGTTGTTTTPASAAGPVVAKVKVRETDFELDPQNPRIPRAGVVQFDVTNAGEAPHALEVEGPKGEVETDTIEPGGKATLKADLSKAGSYVWYCPVGDHETRGMKGRITVGGGGARGSSTRGPEDSKDGAGKSSGDARERDDGMGGGSDGHGGY